MKIPLARQYFTAFVFIALIASVFSAPQNVNCDNLYCNALPLVFTSDSLAVEAALLTRTISGQYRITGAVSNHSTKTFYNVSVRANLHGQNNELIEVITGTTILTATLSGQLNPFDVIARSTVFNTNVYSVNVSISAWSLNAIHEYQALSVIGIDTLDTSNHTVIVKLQNSQPRQLFNVQAVAWAPNQCFSINKVDVARSISSGGTVAFTMTLGTGTCAPIERKSIHVAAQGMTSP